MNRALSYLLAAGALAVAAAPAAAQAQAGAFKLGVKHDGNVQYPQYSPDGTRIAYEVNFPADKRTELYIVGQQGHSLSGEPTRLVPESMASTSRYGSGGKRITHEFSWAYQGDYAYSYTVSDASGAQEIYIDNWSQMVGSDGSANKNSSWDPKSSRFVFSSGRTGNGDLYLWDAGSELQLTYDEANGELYPTWNPAGDKIAFVRAGKSGSHIFLLDVNLFSAVPLVQYEAKDSTRPSFGPDGSMVAFFSNKATDSPTKFGLWVTPARPGGSPRNIGARVLLPTKGGASWTPDGKGVVAVLDDPDKGDPVCIFPVDGGSPNCLATKTRVNRDPQLRVIDGTWRLLFVAQAQEGDNDNKWRELYAYDIPR